MTVDMSDVAMCALSTSLNPSAQGLSGWSCVAGYPTTSVCVRSISNWGGVTCKSGKVTTLLLGGLSLVGAIPTELGLITGLDRVDLYSNRIIGTIPTSVGNLISLTYLHLADNSLIGKVPSTFGLLSGLRYLNLGSNSVTGSIPSNLCILSSLSYLNLVDNNLACYMACLTSVAKGIFDDSLVSCTDGKKQYCQIISFNV